MPTSPRAFLQPELVGSSFHGGASPTAMGQGGSHHFQDALAGTKPGLCLGGAPALPCGP